VKENSRDWWEARYRDSEAFLYSKEPSEFLMEFSAHFPKGAKVLDLGCGEGRNAVALAKAGCVVDAYDFSEEALNRAQKLAESSQVSINFKKMDLDFFLPELLTYDALVAVDFRPPQTLLKNTLRGLKKDGFLFIEAYLTPACLEMSGLEVFECYKPGELLPLMGFAPNQRVIFYSELSGKKLQFVLKKTEML